MKFIAKWTHSVFFMDPLQTRTMTPVWTEPHQTLYNIDILVICSVALVDCPMSIILPYSVDVYLKRKYHEPITIYGTRITVTLLTYLMFSVYRLSLVISSFSCLHIQEGNVLWLLSCLSSDKHLILYGHPYCIFLLLLCAGPIRYLSW